MVAHVAKGLGELREKVVFLGGAVVGLLITDEAAPSVRPTQDVDIIVEIASKADYYQLAESLRRLDFREDQTEDAPVCRWKIDEVTVDVMPTSKEILGFSNRWYSPAIEAARRLQIEKGVEIKVVSAPFFLATKIQAFLDRGAGDYYASPDMEDIIAVLDGRSELLDEIKESPADLRDFLIRKLSEFLDDKSFVDSLPGHLPADFASQQRLPALKRCIEEISAMAP